MMMKPPPIKPITRGLRELTLFFPPDRIAIYRFKPEGLLLVRVLKGVQQVEKANDRPR